jgi:hypothetical protein
VRKFILLYVFILFSCAVIVSCTKKDNSTVVTDNASTITLRWVKSYDNETKDKVETGFKWALLFLGAQLNEGSYEQSAQWQDEKLTVDFSKLGFSPEGLDALKKLIAELKQSGEYKDKGGIDIGRFIMLTLNSPYHYYAITNAPKTYNEYKNRLSFDNKKAAIIESNIAKGHRLIDVPDPNQNDLMKSGFASAEGSGKINDGTFKITELEVFDFMPNGIFRFMLYDESGKLKPAGDTALGGAGKPSKCLWCHEIVISPAFISKTPADGYYTPKEYEDIITRQTEKITKYRKSLKQDIDYGKTQDHTFTEILYISFMEPSAERLAKEWGIPVQQVKEKLKGLPTHTHDEFPYLGTLYDRNDIDKLSPYSSIRTPNSAREPSEYEPDLIK